MRRRAPDFSISRSTAPMPNVSSWKGWYFPGGSRAKPFTCAVSKIAVPASGAAHHFARQGRPAASVVSQMRRSAPSRVPSSSPKPSPPSDMGTSSRESCGRASAQPRAIAAAASGAVSVPLNLSGTIKMRSAIAIPHCRIRSAIPMPVREGICHSEKVGRVGPTRRVNDRKDQTGPRRGGGRGSVCLSGKRRRGWAERAWPWRYLAATARDRAGTRRG